jgi:hypothetical protein
MTTRFFIARSHYENFTEEEWGGWWTGRTEHGYQSRSCQGDVYTVVVRGAPNLYRPTSCVSDSGVLRELTYTLSDLIFAMIVSLTSNPSRWEC